LLSTNWWRPLALLQRGRAMLFVRRVRGRCCRCKHKFHGGRSIFMTVYNSMLFCFLRHNVEAFCHKYVVDRFPPSTNAAHYSCLAVARQKLLLRSTRLDDYTHCCLHCYDDWPRKVPYNLQWIPVLITPSPTSLSLHNMFTVTSLLIYRPKQLSPIEI